MQEQPKIGILTVSDRATSGEYRYLRPTCSALIAPLVRSRLSSVLIVADVQSTSSANASDICRASSGLLSHRICMIRASEWLIVTSFTSVIVLIVYRCKRFLQRALHLDVVMGILGGEIRQRVGGSLDSPDSTVSGSGGRSGPGCVPDGVLDIVFGGVRKNDTE